jgi:hypothetical protein
MAAAQPGDSSDARNEVVTTSHGATEPVAMTDTELDQVTAGALLDVDVRTGNILSDNKVGVSAAVAAAVAALGAAAFSGAGSAAQIH